MKRIFLTVLAVIMFVCVIMVQADPILLLARMPICGDQDDSDPPITYNCTNFVPRIVQKLDLDGWQKVKGLERTASNQPITQSEQKRPSKSAGYLAIVHSFAEFRGEATVAKQGEEAHEEESKAVKGYQFIELSWLGSRIQRWYPKVIVDDTAQDGSLADKPIR